MKKPIPENANRPLIAISNRLLHGLLVLISVAISSEVRLQGAPASPVIVSLTASANVSNPGYATRLAWSVQNTTDLVIDQGVGDVANQAFIYVSPTQTTTYTLTAFNGPTTVTRQVTVNVIDTPPPAFGNGTTYYVSPSGSDSNNGLSASTPWRTVAKVNGTAFQPGDKILFQRGGEWHESLAAPASGSAGNPIAFADYGAGAKPKFWGSEVLNNSAFNAIGGGLYTYNISSQVLAVLVNHTFFYSNPSNNAATLVNSWSYSGGTMTINSPASDPRTDGRVYTAVLRQDVVFSGYKNHLIFRNLVVDESAAFDGGYAFRIENSTDVLVDSCEAYRAARHHFGVINSTQFIGRNLYAAWAMPGEGHGGATAYVSYGDVSSSLPNQTSEWHNCVWDHASDPQDNDNYYSFYTHGSNITSVLVDNMSSLGGNFAAGNGDNPAASVIVKGGLIQNARVEVYGQNVLFDGMYVTGPYGTLDMIGSNLTFQNMLLEGGYLETDGYSSAIISRGSGNTLRFSTIVLDSRASSAYSCLTLDSNNGSNSANGAHFKYYGNICVAPQTALKQWDNYPVALDFAQLQYNLYSPGNTFWQTSANGNQTNVTFSQWLALGADSGSVEANPLFVDATNSNYTLQQGSPAIAAAGLPGSLVNTPPAIATDFAGNPRLTGNGFDMGAFANSGSGPSGPVTISVSPQSATLIAGQSLLFTPTVTGASNLQVAWSLAQGGTGSISSTGVYTAPTPVSSQQTATVQAVSSADPTKTATATIVLLPVSVVVNLPNATVAAGQNLQFTATVTGSSNTQVSWSLLAGGVGAISASGLYTAPSVVLTSQTVTIQAASIADPTKTATALVTLTPSVPVNSTVSVADFGAVADGVLRTGAAMTAGSAILTSASGTFTPADTGKYIQVIGAGHGGTNKSDGTIQAASTTLTSPSASFISTDVGRGIIVMGAGPNGGPLVTSIAGQTSATTVTMAAAATTSVTAGAFFYGGTTLEATIKSVTGPTNITLSATASSTVVNSTYAYGTDNHGAFQSALDAVGQAGGGTVIVPKPANCSSGAVCGYVTAATDQLTAHAPGAVKIRYSNVTLTGDVSKTNLFCRGAWNLYSNSAKFPGQSATIRGNCIAIGDDGGPNGVIGKAVSNIAVSNLHLYGMTDGNTQSISFSPTQPPLTDTGDGWDETHKAIYLYEESAFTNITIDSVYIQDFKGENIFSGGSIVKGMVISNSTMTNFNGDGIAVMAVDLQVLNNTISNGSNAGIEDASQGGGAGALVRQLYQSNTISQILGEGITVNGVDAVVATGTIQIINNFLDTIGQLNSPGARTGIYIVSQVGINRVAPANVTISGNTCHDCYSFAVLQPSGAAQVSGNTFIIDNYNATNFLSFTFPLTNVIISNNTGFLTSAAIAKGRTLFSVYQLNPGYQTGNFFWNQVKVQNNNWNFPGVPNYEFNTLSGLGWSLLTNKNIIWQGDVCTGCVYPDVNHGIVSLAGNSTIRPYGPVVSVNGNTQSVAATIDASKEQDGSEVQIVNSGANPVVFTSDANLSLVNSLTLPSGGYALFHFDGTAGKFTLKSTSVAGVTSAPSFSPVGGTFTAAPSVAISSLTAGASIRYTIDGSTPTSSTGIVYGGAVQIVGSATLKAIAYLSGLTDSAVSTAVYTINLPSVSAPVFNPGGGTFTAAQAVAITSSTAGASIRYTTDGTTPSENLGTLYSAAVPVASSATLKAIAYQTGMTDSAISSAAYTINLPQVAAPIFNPAGGAFASAQSVTITTSTSGASIRYTTDGSTPSSVSGSLYSGPVTVSSTSTLKAVAIAPGLIDSALASAAFTISSGNQGWFSPAWPNRKAVTVDHTKVVSSQANFPLLISVTDANLKSITSGGGVGKTDGTDILFTGSDGISKLNHEIESYNPATGQIVAWVNLPALSSGSDTVIYVYFGNASGPDQQNKAGVWDANFAGVWHMADNALSQTVAESTLNAGNGTARANTSIKTTAGQIAGALAFDGISDYVRVPNSSALDIPTNTPVTMETWVNVTAFPTTSQVLGYLLGKGYSDSAEAYFLRIQNDGGSLSLKGGMVNNATYPATWLLSGWNAGEWHHVASSWDGVNWNVFFDGVLKAQLPTGNGPLKMGLPLTIGGESISGIPSGLLGAKLDELRISRSARSAGWIATEYNNQHSPVTFLTLGALQALTGGQVGAPVFSPAGGSFTSPQSVTIASATPGASIRYTTDGSTPSSTTGTLYAGLVSVATSSGLKAIAYASGMADSVVTSAAFTIGAAPQVSAPVINPAGGSFTSTQLVSITSGTGGAVIRYTTDGSTPSQTNGILYGGPVPVAANITLKAIGYAAGITDSTVTSAAFTISAASQGWYSTAWPNRKSITVDHTKVSGAGLTNFPLLFSVTDPTLKSASSGGSVGTTDGRDILFTASDGVTKLNHEIETYNPGTGQLSVWVNIPAMSNLADTVIYAYFGNTAATDQQNRSGVWDRSFAGVWHMADNASSATVADSSLYGNDGTARASTNTRTRQGQIGSALTFNGTSDYASVPNTPSLDVPTNTPVTTESWVNISAFTSTNQVLGYILGKGYANNAEAYFLRIQNDGGPLSLKAGMVNSSTYAATWPVSGWNPGEWHHVASTWDGVGWKVFVDGVLKAQLPTGNGALTLGIPLTMAGESISGTITGLLACQLDEVRISTVARSAAWIATEFNNQSSPASFFVLGALQTASGGQVAAAPIVNPAGGNFSSTQSVTITTTTGGASIRYTTDGSAPTQTAGTLYTAPIAVAGSMTLKAIAYLAGVSDSSVTSATFTIGATPQAVTPAFNPAGGSFTSAQSVSITTATPGALIRYTTDGSTPTATVGNLYSGPIPVAATTTLKAIAYLTGMADSSAMSAAFTISATGGQSWYDTAWSTRKPVTVDHTRVSGSSSLTNFPMLFSFTDPSLKAASFGGSVGRPDGTDILFTAADGVTKLNHEIESYNPGTGQLTAWLNLPVLGNAADTVVYVYFGNASATDQQNRAGVWDANFAGVWHMSDSASSTTVADSTRNAGNASAHVSTSSKTTTGQIGGALVFDGVSDYASAPNTPALDIPTNTPVTTEAWVNLSAFTSTNQVLGYLIGKGYANSAESYFLRIQNDGGSVSLKGGMVNSATFAASWTLTGWNTGEWHHVVNSWDGSGWNLFFDGVLKAQLPTGNGPLKLGLPLTMGGESIAGTIAGLLACTLDEVRISTTARSSSWVATEYNNQHSPATFYTVGANQTH